MRYDQIRYVSEDQDPSITIETSRLVSKVIDNTGLELAGGEDSRPYFGRYGTNSPLPISHHLGYHGIRTLYDRSERRNLVVPLASWLNLQGVNLQGIVNDPVDERAWAGVARGWPMRLEASGEGAALVLDEMPETQFRYRIEFQPAEPDGIDISVQFTFRRRSSTPPHVFTATWPCYVNAYDDVRLFYPRHMPDGRWKWANLGRRPDIVIGEAVGYRHRQEVFQAVDQAIPLGYGRIGRRALILMFDDPRVKFFVVNAGGHFPTSSVQNPAWDISWSIPDCPLGEPVGFNGRLVYAPIRGKDQIWSRYAEWIETW